MNNKEVFINLLRSTNREGIEDLISWLESSDFFVAPASTRFHGAYEGGLLEHSLNVYEQAKRLMSAYPEVKASNENVIIASLLHDICKANLYGKEKRNRKNAAGQWESYDSYTVDEKFRFGGHGSKSMFLAYNFIKLEPAEAIAINSHMSSWEEGAARNAGSAFEQCNFAWLIHVADEAATYIDENV